MPHMTGVELLQAQSQRGCKLDNKNKAVLSGYVDQKSAKKIKELGCFIIQKPARIDEIAKWVDECEKRFDLSVSLEKL